MEVILETVTIPKYVFDHIIKSLNFYASMTNYKRVVDGKMSDVEKDRGKYARTLLKNIQETTFVEDAEITIEPTNDVKPKGRSWKRSISKRDTMKSFLPQTSSEKTQK